MTRVSLREAYDNKDVVAQIYAIRDTAESAEDTAEQAVTTANTASEHVDALVPQVEGAVENANSASASAQASAQTVAGYENRLGAVEGDVVQLNTDVDGVESDLNAVTLRVTTAEGNIVTIQGRVTALETADGQNVKINRINDYAVGLTGNQTALGDKTWAGNQTYNRNLFVVRAGTDVTVIPSSAFNTLVKEIYDGNNHMTASEFVTKNPNGSTWNVRNFFHYYKDESEVVHTVRVGVYYTIENTQTTVTLKRVINMFIDGASVSSETEYTKTVNL